MKRVSRTRFYSKKIGDMPLGCKLCVKGKKTVLYITGRCLRKCFYCPLSDNRKNKDFVWANEWKIKSKADVITEAKLCSSEGVGITGGDPLLKIDRTISHILMLKKHFGKKFHIHLYTALNLVTKTNLERLYRSGLDEIRFHPDFNKSSEWEKISLAKKYPWQVGIEIPVIPGYEKQTKKLIDFAKDKVNFLNLNELEISDNNANKLGEMGFKTKDKLSYAIKGSEQMATSLLNYCAKKTKLNVHYCSSKLKDKVQLRNRLKLRAKNVAKKYDKITSDGMLIRGAVYLPTLTPGFDYHFNIQRINKRRYVKKLYDIKKELKRKFGVGNDLVEVDKDKIRILTSPKLIRKFRAYLKQSNLKPAVVEEYPTQDKMEVDVNFL